MFKTVLNDSVIKAAQNGKQNGSKYKHVLRFLTVDIFIPLGSFRHNKTPHCPAQLLSDFQHV